jgi:hypothetical protein
MPTAYPPLPPGYAPYPLIVQPAPKSSALRNVVIILAILIALGGGTAYYFRNGRTVTIGSKDQVVYSGSATQDQAIALGNALKTDGYFQDRGVTVLLKMGAGGTVMSFVVQDGYWNQPGTLSEFEEVVREVASPVGGLPVKLQLMDTKLDVEKTSTVGEAQFTGGDAVYYEGNATLAEAQALGQQLQSLGFFTGKGVNVFLVRHDEGTTLAYVVSDGAWDDDGMVNDFEILTRGVAPTVGGLPIEMRMVNTSLVVEKDETIQ